MNTSVRRRGPAWLPFLLLAAASACGSEAPKQSPATAAASGDPSAANESPGSETAAAEAVPEAAAVRAATAAAAPGPARRCGWLHNPTPGNWWLADRDGEWILATQGGAQAEGMEEMPDMSTTDWEETNGHYGYGCACLTITADAETKEVTRIAAPEPKPLAQCRGDQALPRP